MLWQSQENLKSLDNNFDDYYQASCISIDHQEIHLKYVTAIYMKARYTYLQDLYSVSIFFLKECS